MVCAPTWRATLSAGGSMLRARTAGKADDHHPALPSASGGLLAAAATRRSGRRYSWIVLIRPHILQARAGKGSLAPALRCERGGYALCAVDWRSSGIHHRIADEIQGPERILFLSRLYS